MYNAFRIPPDIVFGEDSLQHLATLTGQRAMIVTGGSSMKRFGFLDQCKVLLEQAGMQVKIFDGVEPNPSVHTVNLGAAAMRSFEPDWIVALGGGSALDAAKIMWAFYEYPHLQFADILPMNSIPPLRQKARFIAIPSTSGTASEITAFSVITDTDTHIKHPIVSMYIIPDLAIVDPTLPAQMPPEITAHTGMDVLAHALEAYVSTGANSYTDPLAMEAIQLVFRYLPEAYRNGNNMEARYHMHNASTIAGMAFSNASLGIVHSLAHKIGGEFGVTHGLANAILMPYIVKYNRKENHKFSMIEKTLNIADLVTAIKALNQTLNIPLSFKELGDEIPEERFEEIVSRMSIHAFQDPCTLSNPRKTCAEDIEKIYRYAYRGADVDF